MANAVTSPLPLPPPPPPHSPQPPSLRSSEKRTRLTLSPPAACDDINRSLSATTISTRRTSRSGPLLVLGDDERTVRQLPDTPARSTPSPALRANSRKRPATNDTTAPDTRPPTKVTRTPQGDLYRNTNGVFQPLGIAEHHVPSARPASRPGSAGKLVVPTPASAPAPASASQAKDKRSLRSHDGGSRLKSDLAVYFSNYDDIITGASKPADDFLDPDTLIYIVDEPLKAKTPAPIPTSTPTHAHAHAHASTRTSQSPTRTCALRVQSPSRKLSLTSVPPAPSSTSFQVLDYTSVSKAVRNDDSSDPLADAVFFTQHRRAERKEKQLRNIEKERAMHEKAQLERLLDGLQGPDWLKVMGITGVTDGEKKDWEPKRDYFVKEVEALVDKFRVWKEEEKRLRAEKEAALAALEASSDDDEGEDESDASVHHDPPPEPEPPKPRRPPRPHGYLLPYVPPEPAGPFMSFYAKPHLRAIALGKQRHGRGTLAFGCPVPEFAEAEFELPVDFIDPQFLRDNARQRRRRKRESAVDASTIGG